MQILTFSNIQRFITMQRIVSTEVFTLFKFKIINKDTSILWVRSLSALNFFKDKVFGYLSKKYYKFCKNTQHIIQC